MQITDDRKKNPSGLKPLEKEEEFSLTGHQGSETGTVRDQQTGNIVLKDGI